MSEWVPSMQITIRSPSSKKGRKHLQSEMRLFCDFLDGEGLNDRCR